MLKLVGFGALPTPEHVLGNNNYFDIIDQWDTIVYRK